MIKVDTGSSLIFRFDDVLDIDICNKLTDIAKTMNGGVVVDGELPWHAKENMPFFKSIKDDYLRNSIKEYGEKVEELVLSCYNEKAYVHFTDLVLWREGRQMSRHKDDGYSDRDRMNVRHFTTVTYLNQEYLGGETLIWEKDKDIYINKPKTGSLLILLSDNRCEHAVRKVIGGDRVTLPIWLTKDINHKERLIYT